MKISEYQKKSKETAFYPDRGKIAGLMYCTLGLVGEVVEFSETLDLTVGNANSKDQVKEAGDVLWYVAQIANELDIVLEEPIDKSEYSDPLICVGNICELVKKYYRDGVSDGMFDILEFNLNNIVYGLDATLEVFGLTLGNAMSTNIAKLQSRKDRGKLGGSGNDR